MTQLLYRMLSTKLKCLIKHAGFFKPNRGSALYFWSGWHGDCIRVAVLQIMSMTEDYSYLNLDNISCFQWLHISYHRWVLFLNRLWISSKIRKLNMSYKNSLTKIGIYSSEDILSSSLVLRLIPNLNSILILYNTRFFGFE